MATERFNSKWVESNSGCWLWTAYKCEWGYGRFRLNGKSEKAHRVSYEMFIGPIPEDIQVLHNCDTPACVNPNHLFLGNNDLNVCDKVQKGRQTKGSSFAHSRLTERDIPRIRKLTSHKTNIEIGHMFGVHNSIISRIKNGHTWIHA